jgi:hypothetical protein
LKRAVDAQGAFALAAQDLDPVALLGVAKGIEVAEDVGDRASVPRRASPILGPCRGGFRFGVVLVSGATTLYSWHTARGIITLELSAQRSAGHRAWRGNTWGGGVHMLRVKLEEARGSLRCFKFKLVAGFSTLMATS